MKTNHLMIANDVEQIYCKKLNKVVRWTDNFFTDNCKTCPYFYGMGGGSDNVTVECSYDDGSNKPFVTMTEHNKLEKGVILGAIKLQ